MFQIRADRPSIPVVEEVGYQPLEQAEANLVFRIIAKRHLNNRRTTPQNRFTSTRSPAA